ncbi:AraC family transcriptional regulator [Haloprofundus marisrubri]|uniref:AraC family transcriptional regulator n=1 Tax=Haloprofundus marisrubri TaxID=1514971 RepID=A0A0W1R4J9_9EURY|nr:DJ-1/PfpI family protein [Haloprofundus marisrubri]KTG08369.1 AraC family transcriptional regulator [Haloprofundus marisrubri]
MRVDIVLYDGFDELDAVGPYEVFSTAAAFGADFDVRLVTLDDREQVTASHGLRVGVDGVLPDSDADDRSGLLIVPGGGWNDRSEAGARAEAERGAIPHAVSDLYDAGATVASVCTGGMLLATAGLTDGRPAVTHGGALDDLRASGADVVDARFVDDGDLLTAGGVTSGIDLSLHLVEREAGAEIADRVAAELEYERRETPYRG